MVAGRPFQTTARCGSRLFQWAGHLIGLAAGFGNHIGAGLGFHTNRGAGLRTTTVAGFSTAGAGRGGLDRFTVIPGTGRFGRRRTSPSSDSEATADSQLASVPSDGCQLGRVIGSTPGTGRIARAST